ncbi:MAG: anaerobic ribonucleoside-triphosphate reductase [Roseateles sp.]
MEAVIERQEQALTLRDEERQRCEVWTRVMGYHRPVASFNIGKQGEFAERTPFEEARISLS